jgi:hypothetical protein
MLVARDSSGGIVAQITLRLSAFYDTSHPLIDSSEYRRTKSIAVLHGRLHGVHGQVLEEFENQYDPHGQYINGWSRYSDGTILGDP